jgi:tetratricopeptide (TPR) repeat protein
MTDERSPSAELDALERRGELARAAALARTWAADAAEPAERARRLVRAADLIFETEGPPAARTLLDAARTAARTAKDGAVEALVLSELARLELSGRDAEALARAEELLDRADRAAGKGRSLPPVVACRVEHYRGLLASRRGQPGPSIAHLRRAYELADGEPSQRARILNSWGLQLEAWGDPDEARRLLERSLELKLELEDQYGAAATYGSLAFLHMRYGAYADARDALARDLEICERLGARDLLPSLHARLAGALVGLGRLAGAEREAQTALELAAGSSSVPTARAIGFAWRELARVRRAQERLAEAEAAARGKSLAAFEALRDPYGGALARLTLAEIELDRHDKGDRQALARGQEALDGARRVFARLGAVHETAEALLLQARIMAARRETAQAVELLRERLLPLIERMARAAPHLRRATLDLLAQADGGAGDERLEVLGGMRRVETLLADRAGVAGRWTVVAMRLATPADAARAARATATEGGILCWHPPDRAVVLFAGDDADARAGALGKRLGRMPIAVAGGEATVLVPWPAPPTASGPAVDAALTALAGPARRKESTAPTRGRGHRTGRGT